MKKSKKSREENIRELKASIMDDIDRVMREQMQQEKKKPGLENLKKVRTYKNKARLDKVVYKKPVEVGRNKAKKILLFLCICFGISAFFGIKANSYYIYKGGKVNSLMSCSFSWLFEEKVSIKFSPFYVDVFGVAFLIWFLITSLMALFLFLDSEQRKQSRVGHEHGKARLGTVKDFRSFKVRFMDK